MAGKDVMESAPAPAASNDGLTDTDLAKNFSEIWDEMTFSSISMGKSIGVTVKQPYLDPMFMDYAKTLPINLKINFENGIKYGKWILRKAYAAFIPKEVIWRSKAPLEQGTGTAILPDYFEKEITNDEFEEKKILYRKKYDVKLSSKEQMVYYELFRKRFGKPSHVYNDKNGNNKSLGFIIIIIAEITIIANFMRAALVSNLSGNESY